MASSVLRDQGTGQVQTIHPRISGGHVKRDTVAQIIRHTENRIIENINDLTGQKRRIIYTIRDLADTLEIQQKGVKIGKITFASIGIAASIIGTVGVALAPVTAGASLVLAATGISIGILSGAGGVGTEIAAKVLDSKALKKAQAELREHSAQQDNLILLIDDLKKKTSKETFKRFVEEKLNKISPKIGKWIFGEQGKECVDASPSTRVAAAAGKIVSEVFEAAGKSIKIGSLFLSVVTIPLDIYTIVSNSLDIHRKSTSKMAQYLRKLADDLEAEEMKKDEMNTISMLRRKNEKLEREAQRQRSKWIDSVENIGQDVAHQMKKRAVVYDFVKGLMLRAYIVSFLIHIFVRPCLLFAIPCIFITEPVAWVYQGVVLSLVYDGFYLLLNTCFECYTVWATSESNKEVEKGLYAASNVFNSAPTDILSSVQTKLRPNDLLRKPDLQYGSYFVYNQMYEYGLVVAKTLLDIAMVWFFSETIMEPADDFINAIFPLPFLSWLCIFPLSSSVGRPDLLVFWLVICTLLLIRTASDSKEMHTQGMCTAARDILRRGEEFKQHLDSLCCISPGEMTTRQGHFPEDFH